VAQGGEFRVNSFTTNNQYNPAVGMDAAGDFVVAWSSYGQDGSGYGVYAQRYKESPGTILDDGSDGFTATAPWLTYQGPEVFQGDVRFIGPGSGSNTATWTFTGLTPGQAYRVSATWFGHPIAASNAPFTITGGATPASATVNQKLAPAGFSDAGAPWQVLAASYTVTGTTLVVQLSDLANGYVEADAVRVEPVAYPVQIVDDGNDGFSTVGTWQTYQGPEAFQYDVDFRQGFGTGSNTATWTFAGLAAGSYRVSATWFGHPLAATNARYTVRLGTTALRTTLVNQRLAPATLCDAGALWQDLGNLYTISGGTLTVTLTDQANGYVQADAIRVERVG
jgi:hypothetical protein